MAPRSGPRVTVVSPNSGTVTTLSRSASAASSSVFSSDRVSPSTAAGPLLRRGGPRREDKNEANRMDVSAAAAPPQSGRAVLRAIGINTLNEAGTKHRICPASHTPPPPPPSTRDTRERATTTTTSLRERRDNDSSALPDFFEASGYSSSNGINRRHPQPFTSHAPSHSAPPPSRSTSRSHQRQPAQPSHPLRTQSRAEEDDEAIQRAAAALARAGGAVLRRPFRSHMTGLTSTTASSSDKSTSTLLGGNTSSLPMCVASPHQSTARHDGDSAHRGMRLPATIPITRADSEDDETSVSSSVASRPHKRSRSWSDAGDRSAFVSARPHAQQGPMAAFASSLVSDRMREAVTGNRNTSRAGPAPPLLSPAAPRVCPGMFAGLSAIPLDPRLFTGVGPEEETPYSVVPSKGSKSSAEGSLPQRYCARPLWSLVGTFKTSLSGLVTVDRQQNQLRWHQRNPNGGQQCIKVPLSQVLDVFTTRVVQEDENVEERQFTVVVRTSTRPSQVVFGFATATTANQMRGALMRR